MFAERLAIKGGCDFNEAIELAPMFELAYRSRSWIYELKGQRNLSRKDRAKADELRKAPAEKKI